jgi:hypothetical protein
LDTDLNKYGYVPVFIDYNIAENIAVGEKLGRFVHEIEDTEDINMDNYFSKYSDAIVSNESYIKDILFNSTETEIYLKLNENA